MDQSAEAPAIAVVLVVDGVAHYEHMEAAAEDFEIAEEVVADHTVAAGNLEEHNLDGNSAQTKEQVQECVVREVDGWVADAGEDHGAEDVAVHDAGRVAHSGCVVAIEVHHNHFAPLIVEHQEFEALYMAAADEVAHCTQLVDLVLG